MCTNISIHRKCTTSQSISDYRIVNNQKIFFRSKRHFFSWRYLSIFVIQKKLNLEDNMSGQAPWPVRKGVFRSVGQSDYTPVRSPSPVIEIPPTPQNENTPHSSIPVHTPVFTFEKAKSPPLTIRSVREIPIELHEVIFNFILHKKNLFS